MKLYPWVESLATFTINICFATALILGMATIVGMTFLGVHAVFKNNDKNEEQNN